MNDSTLWIYGDSFSVDIPEVDWQWFKQLGIYWGIKLLKNFSTLGAGQPHTLYCVSKTESDWAPDDKVIILLPEIARSWFVPSDPAINGVLVKDLEKLCKKIDSSGKLHTAIELYHLRLQHYSLVETQLHSTLGYLSYLSQNKKNEIIILNCTFDNRLSEVYEKFYSKLKLAKGCLSDISYSEMEDDPNLRQYIWGHDPRSNHLCKSTHDNLANHIINFSDDNSIDLNSLILKNPIITKKNVDDDQLINFEFMPEVYNATKRICERKF